MSLMFPTIYSIAFGDLTEEQSKVQARIIYIEGNDVVDTTILGFQN